MATATYWQKGATIDYLNSGSTKIEANTIINLSTRIGVAGTEIPAGEVGTVHVENVFILPKDSAAITLGAAVYYIPADSNLSATKGTNGILAGWAVEAASASATEVKVKLQG